MKSSTHKPIETKRQTLAPATLGAKFDAKNFFLPKVQNLTEAH